ncbi:MAG: hypothetical protein RRC34_13330 [Lentisphaeria bacterium]|nr:hypothetical protein [Lentisphaeria bacterium]
MDKKNLFVLAAGLLLATGCGDREKNTSPVGDRAARKVSEKLIEAQMGGQAEVDIDKDTVSIRTEEGQFDYSAGASVSLPEGFPADVVVYEGAKLESSMRTPDGFMLQMRSPDALEKITRVVGEKMKAKGWSQSAAFNMGGQSALSFEKEGRAATVSANKDGDSTMIVIVVDGAGTADNE